MGYKSVNTVMTRWTHLNDQPFRALTFLAHMAHDDYDPPPYFGGHRAIAQALGFDPDAPRVFERVRRILRTLEAAGAIVAGMTGKAGQRRDYALTLDPRTTYRAQGEHDVEFTRRQDGAPAEVYAVHLTQWERVAREDPRPPADLPHHMGCDLPRDMGDDLPRDMGDDLPRDVGPTSHVTWDPTRTTHKHDNGKPPQTQTATPIQSQRKSSTRVHASRRDDDEGSISQDQRANDQGRRLREMFGDLDAWTPDAEEATA